MKHFSKQSSTIVISLVLWVTLLSASVTQKSTMTFPAQEIPIVYSQPSSNDWVQQNKLERPNDTLTALSEKSDLQSVNKISDQHVIYIGAGFDRSYSTVDSISTLQKSPFLKSNSITLSGEYQLSSESNWGMYALGGVDLATRNDSSLTDRYNTIGSAGVSYTINPDLKFSFGIMSTRNLANHEKALPIIGIDWNITDRLRLRTFNGAFLTYDLGKSTQMDISLQYLDQSFAIENMQGTIFMKMNEQDTILEESAVVGTLGVKHKWKDVFSIRAFAELVGQREFQIVLEETDIQPIPERDRTLSFGVEGGIRF